MSVRELKGPFHITESKLNFTPLVGSFLVLDAAFLMAHCVMKPTEVLYSLPGEEDGDQAVDTLSHCTLIHCQRRPS